MLEQGLAGLLELLEARTVDLLSVVGPLRQGVAGDVVAAGDPGRVEARVVDAARGLVDPAAGDALEDDLEGGLERDGQVDGDDALEAAGLRGVAGVPVEDEGRRRVLGGLRGRGGVAGGKGAECHAVAGLHLCGGSSLGRERHNLGGSVALQPAAVAELAGYEPEHEVVGDEAAGLHGALGLDACADVNGRSGLVLRAGRCLPRGVLFLTLLRSKSPVLMDASWGNRPNSRSLWVPLPTPGAPTRITLAALLSCI